MLVLEERSRAEARGVPVLAEDFYAHVSNADTSKIGV